MTYQEFVDYIYKRHSGNVKLGLERMENILREMGNPQKELKGFHVAGTNGKGSTCAMLESIFHALEEKTGFNSSPHLIDYRERIRIATKDIQFRNLLESYNKWKHIFEKYEASFFEITTAIAFDQFRSGMVDTAIFEVGLGGRLDATNLFKPTVSIVTTIAIDHPKSLGNAIEKIAYEKAGIIKRKVPVVIGKMPEIAKGVIIGKAIEMEAPYYVYGKDFWVDNIELKEDGTYFDYYNPEETTNVYHLHTNLLGEHQAYNAAVAMTAAIKYQWIKYSVYGAGIAKYGITKVNWQGRMQILQTHPLMLVDGAHNEQAMDYLVSNIKKIYKEKKFRTVVAILRDKDFDDMIGKLSTVSSKLYITQNDSKRAATIEEQMKAAKKCNVEAQSFDSIMDALDKAKKEAGDDPVLVTGSLYTISEVLREYQKKI